MTENTLCFPSYFPEGCPPEDAELRELKVYRFCVDNEISKDDFRSYYEINPIKYSGNPLAYGLSVYTDEDDCKQAFKTPGIKKKFKNYAQGQTYQDLGKIKHTPGRSGQSHHTWWIYEGKEPYKFFKICS